MLEVHQTQQLILTSSHHTIETQTNAPKDGSGRNQTWYFQQTIRSGFVYFYTIILKFVRQPGRPANHRYDVDRPIALNSNSTVRSSGYSRITPDCHRQVDEAVRMAYLCPASYPWSLPANLITPPTPPPDPRRPSANRGLRRPNRVTEQQN